MAFLAVLFVIVAVFGSLGYSAIGIVRWARRTGRRASLWLLGSYVLANIVWAVVRPYLRQP
jgi:threonine/homoserine/homoserine lactone efflux protein